MKRPSVPGRDYLLLAGAAAAAAVVTGVVLAQTAMPSNFAQRLAALDQKTEKIHRWALRPGAPDFPQGAVCTGGAVRGEAALRARIAAEAQASQLGLSTLEVRLDPDGRPERSLEPLDVTFEVKGTYQAGLDLMARLALVRPLIFAEAVDLTSNTSSVTLKVYGRAYCVA
jgi:hypothetical protein